MQIVRFLSGWLKREDGSTAIEFSMLCLPFIYILLGTMEISLMFASNSVLDGATIAAARLVKTGQVQEAAGDPMAMFKAKLCDQASALLDCSKFQFEVVEMDKFADFASYAPTYDATGKMVSRGFNPGGVNSINLIRVSYNYPLITPLIGDFLANAPGRTRRMISTIVLETEPYDLAAVSGSL